MGLSKDPAIRAKQIANVTKNKIKKGEVRNPYGQPKKTLRLFLEQAEGQGITIPTAAEVSRMYISIASMTEDSLKKLMADKEQPMMLRIIAKGVLDKKGLDVLEKIVDRAYGKEQRVDITTNGKDLHVEPLQIHFVADKDALAKVQAEVKPLDNGNEDGEQV